jgi:protein-tyrosine phosphatase
MSFINKTIYNVIQMSRNSFFLNLVNTIGNIDDYNLIIPNLYLGNVNYANNLEFLNKHKIGAILNCTENEPFNSYFREKNKFRLSINDSKTNENINKFKSEIINCVNFIEDCLENNISIYIHCYWGLMRSATVVASYLIIKYNIPYKDCINIIKEKRPYAILSIYNFNEVLEYVEEINKKEIKITQV